MKENNPSRRLSAGHNTSAFNIPSHPRRLGQRAGITLGVIVGLWSAGLAKVEAVDPTDTFYGTGAGTSGGGSLNSAFGYDALFSVRGTDNTALGAYALKADTTGNYNTATGVDALFSNVGGMDNTASGWSALYANVDGGYNTADGLSALSANTRGSSNTALGAAALYLNTTGTENTATGVNALYSNLTGTQNTASGMFALYANVASENTAIGYAALTNNGSGTRNTASGEGALARNVGGNDNTADGLEALYQNLFGNNNTATGWDALYSNQNGTNNTACGLRALYQNYSGNNNIALGVSAGGNLTTGSSNIDIGASGRAGESNTIRLGAIGVQTATYVSGIVGSTIADGVEVMIDSTGRVGTLTSSARFKENIQPMAQASEAILSLQPVTFRYKKELDSLGIPQFGLVAEQVAKVSPDLVARDQSGKPYTVRYEAVNAMLLNEFLKEHRKVEAQNGKIESLEEKVARLEVIVEKQGALIEKVSAEQAAARSSARLASANE
ncbi:MAG TPA: tail fiber domain-containing protein [Edaphobacter sp.]|nr:tail fiber domain-containing protein [Edaphobacter sp.]